MRVTTSKSKNSESFYITKSYTNAQGKSTSTTIKKLGTLAELSDRLGTDRDGVMAWAKEQARIETEKYKKETEDAVVMIPFHSNRPMDYNRKKLFTGGYLFIQSIYYGLKMDSICRKIRSRYKYEYDLNAILSDLIYTRVLEPSSKKSSFQAQSGSLKRLPMNFTIFIVRSQFWQRKAISFSPKFIRIVFLWETETTRSFITTAQTITLKSSRKTGIKNMERVKNTALTQSSKWVCLQTEMESR